MERKEENTKSLKRSMMLSLICKPLAMLIYFFYTPVLLHYLGDEKFGIWSTILSVINWINYFDIGIGQGVRNSLTKYISLGDKKKANESVSTGYITLSLVSLAFFLIGILVINLFDISWVFNTETNINPTLILSFGCVCLNFVLSLSKSQLYATHQAEKVGFMMVLIQLINLIGIVLLSFFGKENLLAVAAVVGTSGIICNVLFSFALWGKYEFLKPQIKHFEFSEMKNVCGIGVKFFFIQIAAMILYSTDNLIITRLFGPENVTPYNTAYTAFSVVNSLFAAFMAPLWSKYTVAKQENNYLWIKKTILRLDAILPFIAIVLIAGVFLYKPLSVIWLRKELNYDRGLISLMAIYIFTYVISSIYATLLNGLGLLNIELIFGVIMAILNIPLSIFLGKNCGLRTTGVLMATIVCMIISIVPLVFYSHMYIQKSIKSNNE